jgi:hypothetical protein
LNSLDLTFVSDDGIPACAWCTDGKLSVVECPTCNLALCETCDAGSDAHVRVFLELSEADCHRNPKNRAHVRKPGAKHLDHQRKMKLVNLKFFALFFAIRLYSFVLSVQEAEKKQEEERKRQELELKKQREKLETERRRKEEEEYIRKQIALVCLLCAVRCACCACCVAEVC